MGEFYFCSCMLIIFLMSGQISFILANGHLGNTINTNNIKQTEREAVRVSWTVLETWIHEEQFSSWKGKLQTDRHLQRDEKQQARETENSLEEIEMLAHTLTTLGTQDLDWVKGTMTYSTASKTGPDLQGGDCRQEERRKRGKEWMLFPKAK